MTYNNNATCDECGKTFNQKQRNHYTCSKKCSDARRNKLYKIHGKGLTRQCPKCGAFKSKQSPQCSKCAKEKRAERVPNWLSGKWDGGTKRGLSKTIRSYLLEKADYKCTKCGFDTPHPDDGKTILEINHIDGNGTNHKPENLEVICPNCHALTSSYRARNTGNGRKVYYLRVDKG